ncbi:MAG: hypothetical protein KAS32_03195 [Candidatus Peribacteraceae bacterium]|nr:hypothetical protein [Candidatus Peribacteraceae bacterium]
MSEPRVRPNGDKFWYNEYNDLHREDGPAIIYSNGTQHWFINGERHREDGPAITRIDGSEDWYVNGRRHREGAPARIYTNGEVSWWHHGRETNQPEFEYGSDAEVNEYQYRLGLSV